MQYKEIKMPIKMSNTKKMLIEVARGLFAEKGKKEVTIDFQKKNAVFPFVVYENLSVLCLH